MTIPIFQPFDKLFKVSLSEKKVAISYLKAHVPAEIYKRINIDTLALTDKSFILPKFREVHSDIVYRCQFDNQDGYIFFILEAESTPNEELMAFRQLQYSIAAMDQHIRQGHKKLPTYYRFAYIMVWNHRIPTPLMYINASITLI